MACRYTSVLPEPVTPSTSTTWPSAASQAEEMAERLLLARGELRLPRGNMRCVFVARRQVGIVGARPARMAFAGGSEAGGSPLDGTPASGLPEADRLFASSVPESTRNRALRDARRVFGKPAHAAAVLDDDRALRLQCLKRRGNRAQLSGQLAHAQLAATQRFHDRDLLDGVRTRCELGKRRPRDHPAIVHLADCGLLEAPTAVAPVHHARHAARRREQAHARRQRRDIAFGKPLGAGGALFIEIRLADGALDGLELARVDALRPLRPGLRIRRSTPRSPRRAGDRTAPAPRNPPKWRSRVQAGRHRSRPRLRMRRRTAPLQGLHRYKAHRAPA